jgi:peptide methionine sulfoxide reductase MsrA
METLPTHIHLNYKTGIFCSTEPTLQTAKTMMQQLMNVSKVKDTVTLHLNHTMQFHTSLT